MHQPVVIDEPPKRAYRLADIVVSPPRDRDARYTTPIWQRPSLCYMYRGKDGIYR